MLIDMHIMLISFFCVLMSVTHLSSMCCVLPEVLLFTCAAIFSEADLMTDIVMVDW